MNKTPQDTLTIDPLAMNIVNRVAAGCDLSGDLNFDGRGYLLGFVLPNLFFHAATAHAILRHNGVPLGKLDYLGPAD